MRKGRKDEFARFGWTGDIPDPESEATFLRCKLNWDLQTAGQHRILWHFYQTLLRLRRDVPPLARLDKNALEVTSFNDQNSNDFKLPIPAGNWHTVLDSDEERWCGKGSKRAAVFQSRSEVRLCLRPSTFVVLAQDAEERTCTGRK